MIAVFIVLFFRVVSMVVVSDARSGLSCKLEDRRQCLVLREIRRTPQ